MKKALFFILLALCILHVPLAGAEITHSDSRPVVQYEYTQAIDLYNTTVYIPSVFSESAPRKYISDNAMIDLDTSTGFLYTDSFFFDNPQVVYQDLSAYAEMKTAANESIAEARWVGEYVAVIETYQLTGRSDGFYAGVDEYTVAKISISNRIKWLHIYVSSVEPELVATLTDGILEHIVLPEMDAIQYEFTRPLKLDGFTVFVPSVFSPDLPISKIYDAAILAFTKDYESSEGDASYHDPQLWYQLMSSYGESATDDNCSYETRWIGEHVALIKTEQISSGLFSLHYAHQYTRTTIYISDGEKWLHIEIYTHTPELTSILVEGLLEHIVVAGSAPSAAPVSARTYNTRYNYTQLVECGDFILRLPSFFYKLADGVYTSSDCLLSFSSNIKGQAPESPDSMYHFYEAFQKTQRDGKYYDLIDIKGYPAFVRVYSDVWDDDGNPTYPKAEIITSTGNTQLAIVLQANEIDPLTDYLDGILKHITLRDAISSYAYDDYVQRLIYSGFKVYLPASFEYVEENVYADRRDPSRNTAISFRYDKNNTPLYTNTNEHFQYILDQAEALPTIKPFSDREDAEFSYIQADSCRGLRVHLPQLDGQAWEFAFVFNRYERFAIGLACRGDNCDEDASALMDSVLDHIVAPEIPLE